MCKDLKLEPKWCWIVSAEMNQICLNAFSWSESSALRICLSEVFQGWGLEIGVYLALKAQTCTHKHNTGNWLGYASATRHLYYIMLLTQCITSRMEQSTSVSWPKLWLLGNPIRELETLIYNLRAQNTIFLVLNTLGVGGFSIHNFIKPIQGPGYS